MRRLLAGVLGLVLLAGCGVRPTPPVSGGEGSRGVAEGPTLYFVGSNGRLAPVVRRIGKLGDYTTALTELFKGPQPDDPPGTSSLLPTSVGELSAQLNGSKTIEVRVTTTSGREAQFNATALNQIVCTMAARHLASGRIYNVGPVIVNRASQRCPLVD